MLEIRPIDIRDKKQREEFIRFAWKIYKNDPHWVAPLLMDMRAKLNPDKHPFFEFGTIQAYMAYRDNVAVGRIAAADNPRFNEVHGGKTGFWGFFECIDDQEVANALFDVCRDWLKKKDLNVMHGPASPSSNYDYGLLVEGFDDAPRIMMTYNPQYYVKLVENYGNQKAMGLFAYELQKDRVMANEKLMRVKDVAKERSKVKLRYLDKKNLKSEIPLIKHIYNTAWENNYGFVPMTDAELNALAAELKMVAVEKLFPILENEKGEIIGLAMALPDFNQILQSFNGKLFPFNILKLFTQKKKITWARVILLGLLPEYRNKGLDAVLYYEILKNASDLGYYKGEGSWILEDNPGMNRGLEMMNATIYKRYNVYEKSI